ncbi:hypothetical protein HNR53_003149 [Bacillus benzoevorans]|uniref:Uncharacterized protein n=1 Tax=Bacillus benzoevorans TaxID=1456 RepID=A0A7X0HTE4_9BACI|nr:hypothetical protein [Bacillus benzoevorans]
MNFKKATLQQLYYLARFTEYRYDSLFELDRRVYGYGRD